VDWDSPWVEYGDSNKAPFSDPATGAIQVVNSKLALGIDKDNLMTTNKSIVRTYSLEFADNLSFYMDFEPTNKWKTENRTLIIEMWDEITQNWGTFATLDKNTNVAYGALIDHPYIGAKSKIRFRAGQDWGKDEYLILDYIEIKGTVKDTDSDGYTDDQDLDDDNDGILDSVENQSLKTKVMQTTSWVHTSDSKATGKAGDLFVTVEFNNGVTFEDPPMAGFNPEWKEFWAPSPESGESSLQGHPALYFVYNGITNTTRTCTITLPKPVKKVLIHLDRLGAHDGGVSTSMQFALTAPASATIARGGINENFELVGKEFRRKLNVSGQTHTDSSDTTNGAAAGTIIIENNAEFDTVVFDVDFRNKDGDSIWSSDGVYMIVEVESKSTEQGDTDGDGFSDNVDLDSDNDGIPDTVEAQATDSWIKIANSPAVDGNGVPTQANGGFTTLPDTDGDHVLDFLDSDSDRDDISDCKEGNVNVNCPIVLSTIGNDGMSTEAGGGTAYTSIYGNVDDLWTKLHGDASPAERDYRIARYCGNSRLELKALNWTTVSVPCLMTAGIKDIYPGLGTYGDAGNWVMYEQDADFTGKASIDYPTPMAGTDIMIPGKGYWIIADQDKNVSIDETNLLVTKTTRQLAVNHSTWNTSFNEVNTYSGLPQSSSDVQKVLLGNPFPASFSLGNMFMSNDNGGLYTPMYDAATGDFSNPIVYTYEYAGTSALGYRAITASSTPGFYDIIEPGLGFWLRVDPTGTGNTNLVDYPYEK